MDGLIEGRVVHYVLPDGRSKGESRPGFVVKVWRDADGAAPANGVCNLQVFTDGSNDGEDYRSGVSWKTSVLFDADGKPGTWHWPSRA